MSYTPVELRHVPVERRLFGYDRESVEQILNEVADSFETVWRDRGELADEVEALEEELEALKAPRAARSRTRSSPPSTPPTRCASTPSARPS